MNNSPQHDLICEFSQVFTNSISKTLTKELDTDICTNIQFSIESSSKIQDSESLKENNVIYKLDYATGNRQGTFAVLIPEEFIAAISDIITGGTGIDCYKGSLSEIETNSCLKFLDKAFKLVEGDFKRQYEHDLAFSSNPLLLLKEMEEYSINTDDFAFDFLISNTLSLSDDFKYKINILTNINALEDLMNDLGLSKSNAPEKKTDISLLNVNRLADVKISITAELGRTRVPIKYALELVRGSMVELNTVNNSDIKVFANGVEFAYAQVVAVEENFGLKITRIISPEERLEFV